MAEVVHFEKDVLERSQVVPVVVDFWAPWCGPCQFLGPVIEELATQAHGQWELIKVNTDKHQALSAKYGIRGIPAVKMFYKGQVTAEFTGALPKHQIQKWLEKHLPDERKEKLAAIYQHLFTDQHAVAVPQLETLTASHPDLEEARLRLAAATVGQHPEQARQIAQTAQQHLEMGEDLLSLADLMECQEKANIKVTETIQTAQNALKHFQYEQALKALIEATLLDKYFCNELPRRATIALFRFMGIQHPLTKKYRRRFDMALY